MGESRGGGLRAVAIDIRGNWIKTTKGKCKSRVKPE